MTSKNADLLATVVSGHTFTVDPRYDLKDSKILGRGSYGVVTTANDRLQHGKIAIKRIRPFANDEWDARHTLREIRLLRLLGPHPNIITLFDLSLFEDKTELYMMMELMDCDLHQIIQSKQSLSEMHHKCFAKQMLEGIKAMHDIGVFHRDLKPGNILVSKDCKLRITDFGLARFVDEATAIGENSLNPLTEYVVTRWYRCPELLLAPNRPYNTAIDMWAVGCILAELLRRKPLFPGKSHANQVQLIFEVVGYSTSQKLGFELSSEASSFLEKRCRSRGQPLASVIPQASPDALLIINRLLSVDPHSRPTATQALEFEYLKGAETMCDYDKQYLSRPPADLFDFESEKYSLEQLKELIVGEVQLSAFQNKALRSKLGAQNEVRREDKEIAQSRRNEAKTSSVPDKSLTSSAASSHGISYSSESKVKGMRESDNNLRKGERDDAKITTAVVDDITAEEAELARSQQMDTNPTQRNSLARSLSTNNNINAAQREAMKTTKISTSSNHQGSLAYRQSSNIPKTNVSSATESRIKLSRSGSVISNEESKDALAQHQQSNPSTYGNVLSLTNRGPKTPPPIKMDIIIQKGLKAKKVALEEDASNMKSHSEEKEEMIAPEKNNTSGVASAQSSTGTSSFLKSRHFGFMRSNSNAGRTNQPQHPQQSTTSSQADNHRNDAAHAAGISSLLSQFSGRYQSMSSRAKSADPNANINPNPAIEHTNPSGGPLSKLAASKIVRSVSAPGVQARASR